MQTLQNYIRKVTKQPNTNNKQQQQQNQGSGGETPISRVATLCYLKCPGFNKKLQDIERNKKVWSIKREHVINRHCP